MKNIFCLRPVSEKFVNTAKIKRKNALQQVQLLILNVICWKLTKDIAPQSHRILHTFVWCVYVVGGKLAPPPHKRPCIISRLCAAISSKAHFNESP